MKLLAFFLQLINEIKMYHWSTPTYARHVASDVLFTKLLGLIDQFVEVYQGRYGVRVGNDEVTLVVKPLNDATIVEYLRGCVDVLNAKRHTLPDTDLQNIRDEIVAEIHQALYLFTFK